MPKFSAPKVATVVQLIRAFLRVTGEQEVTVDAHGLRGGGGSYVSVTGPVVAVYVYDTRAADAYINAFIDLAQSPLLNKIPARIERVESGEIADAADSPSLIIRAHGHDVAQQTVSPAGRGTRGAVAIRVGQVVWLMQDQAVYHSYAAAWRQVRELAPIILRKPRIG